MLEDRKIDDPETTKPDFPTTDVVGEGDGEKITDVMVLGETIESKLNEG